MTTPKFFIQFNGKMVGHYDDIPYDTPDDEIRDKIKNDVEIQNAISALECEVRNIVIVPTCTVGQKLINIVLDRISGSDPSIDRTVEV